MYRRTHKKGEKFFDGLGANEKTEGFTRYLDIPLYDMKGQVNTSLFHDFGKIRYDEQHLAETLQPTTNGVHLNITYQLSVKLDYDTYCADKPECTIPLFIQAPQLQNFSIIQAPQDWNPHVYDQSNFA